ncbi:MAG: HAMP domain-containing histidine kinase [Blautia sp.]|nr:HAMP domain-containing histidine kinase [Blautia sp.]
MTRLASVHPLLTQLLILGICILILPPFGSALIEHIFVIIVADEYAGTVHALTMDEEFMQQFSDGKFTQAVRQTEYLSDYRRFTVWLTDANGVLLSSSDSVPEGYSESYFLEMAARFNKRHHYEVGTFGGILEEKNITIIQPVHDGPVLLGYIALHYHMDRVARLERLFLPVLLLLMVIMATANVLPVLFYWKFIHKPILEVGKGAEEFARGNLSYTIPVQTENQIGYLAKTLNYMADKINENGEFQRRYIADVSHDFRSPLTSIKGYAEAMLDHTIPPEMYEKYLRIIDYEASRLEKLTHNLNALGSLEASKRNLQMQTFDLNAVVRAVLETFEGRSRESHTTLWFNTSNDPLFTIADLEKIQQVIYNLVDNAIKFSKPYTTINVETASRNEKIFFSIKDQGIGISKEALPKIWDRFYKEDASRGKDRSGSGLGLAIVKEIILAHDEHINVISTEGVGSEFIFTLPKAKQETEQ